MDVTILPYGLNDKTGEEHERIAICQLGKFYIN